MRGATRWLVVLGAWWVVSGLLLGSWLGRQRQPDVAAAAPPVDAAPPADAPPADAPPTDTGLFDAACSGRTCERSRLGLEEPLSVHVWRTGREDAQKGWRFRHLLDQGLAAHPAVDVVDSAHHADVVLWLPQWAAKAPFGLERADEKLAILDEHDDRERRFGPYAAQRGDAYLAYFKRSFANKSDGAFLGYSVSSAYLLDEDAVEPPRELDVVCTLRVGAGRYPARARVLLWARELARERRLSGFFGEFDTSQRNVISAPYFALMRRARVVVTCNPGDWEGDFRTWEAHPKSGPFRAPGFDEPELGHALLARALADPPPRTRVRAPPPTKAQIAELRSALFLHPDGRVFEGKRATTAALAFSKTGVYKMPSR
ncbi:hypothetical protein JL722_5166 [Aureococcus anophagefferens]|nr:hypothetical protein JL722_5166 [Aureococcus anophagefferens]